MTKIWTIDPNHSTFEFAVRHMRVSTIKGAFGKVEGTIEFDPDQPETAKVEATVDIASLDTHHQGRDEKLLGEHTFEVEQYPTATFRSGSVTVQDPDRFSVEGTMTFRDISKPVTFDVVFEGVQELPDGRERAAFTARATIKRTDFGLDPGREIPGGNVSLSDDVDLAMFTTCNREVAE